jgi:CubicO group peptidase (beta-lactamase class C family)
MKRLLALPILLLLLSPPAQALDVKAVDALAEEALKFWRVPGCAVAIVKDDKVICLKGYGVKERGKPQRVTPDTLFGIGSCTKAIAATAIAILVDEGKMSWDDPVRKHVPFLRLADPLADREATLRDLLCHRTGLLRHDLLWYRAPWTLEESVRRMAHLELTHSFRARFEYNNLSYITLGFAIAKASGMSWDEFVRRRLFSPLGMSGAVFTRSAALAAADHASPHHRQDDAVTVIPWYDDDKQVRASGSVKAGARDLSRWLRFQLASGRWDGKQLVSRRNLLETRRPQVVTPIPAPLEREADTTQASYGLGWRLYDYRGHALATHGGAVDGFRAALTLAPKDGLGLVVLANADVLEMPQALSADLLDLLLGLKKKDWNDIYEAKRKRVWELRQAVEKAWLARRQTGTKPSRELEAYTGRYVHPAYGTATVTLEKKQLVLSWSSFRLPLEHFHHDTFTGQLPHEPLRRAFVFTLGSDGTPARLRFLEQEFKRGE